GDIPRSTKVWRSGVLQNRQPVVMAASTLRVAARLVEDVDDSLGRVAVPERQRTMGSRWIGERLEGFVDGPVGIAADDAIGPVRDGHGPLGRVSERQARNPEKGGLFLNSAGIGQHETGPADERDEVQVPERIDVDDALVTAAITGRCRLSDAMTVPDDLLLHARMDRKHDGNVTCQRLAGLQEARPSP